MRTDTVNARLDVLAWDSRHFGMQMGRFVIPFPLPEPAAADIVRAAMDEAAHQGFQQVMARAMPTDTALIHALESVGFRLMDTLVTLRLDLPPRLPPAAGASTAAIRTAAPHDVPGLMAMARQAFADREIWLDRFHADPHIPRVQADELYAQWVKNSVTPATPQERMADAAWVAELDHQIVGFLTGCRGAGTATAKVSLNAVEKACRGQGIYGQLVRHAIEWFQAQHEPAVTVRTSIASQAVQRAWIRQGAIPVHVEHTFHWWAS